MHPIAHCQKLWVVSEIFPLECAEVFDRSLFESSLNLDCNAVMGVCAIL